MAAIFRVTSILFIAVLSQAYKSGAPPGVCDSMTPHHGDAKPQTGPSPYTLSVDKTSAKVGENITVTIQVNNQSDSFKGFLLQARDEKGNILGKFAKVAETKHINCKSGTKNALSHNSDFEKKKIVTYWNSPQPSRYPIQFRLTVVRNGGEFWVGLTSPKITIVSQ